MRILGVIPARGGSKGIPRKNIKLLKGEPLVSYTSRIAKASTSLDRIIVSTDDNEIAAVCLDYGLEVPFIRPAHLAQDDTPTLPVILHAVNFLEQQGDTFDAVCLLQTTSPFRNQRLIDLAVEKFIKMDADSLISVRPVPHQFNPHWIFEPDNDGFLKIATGDKEIIPRRQALPTSYFRDGALYLVKAEVLKEKQSLYGKNIGFIVHNSEYYVNLDTLEDWQKAEQFLCAE